MAGNTVPPGPLPQSGRHLLWEAEAAFLSIKRRRVWKQGPPKRHPRSPAAFPEFASAGAREATGAAGRPWTWTPAPPGPWPASALRTCPVTLGAALCGTEVLSFHLVQLGISSVHMPRNQCGRSGLCGCVCVPLRAPQVHAGILFIMVSSNSLTLAFTVKSAVHLVWVLCRFKAGISSHFFP